MAAADNKPNNTSTPSHRAAGGAPGALGPGITEEAVVAMLRETLEGVVPLRVTDDGVTVHVDWAGAPEHVSVTVPLNPSSGDACSVSVAVPPAVTVSVLLVALSVKSWPVPLRAAVCVAPAVPPESSVTVSVADSDPAAEGVNVTLIWQLDPLESELPQLLL